MCTSLSTLPTPVLESAGPCRVLPLARVPGRHLALHRRHAVVRKLALVRAQQDVGQGGDPGGGAGEGVDLVPDFRGRGWGGGPTGEQSEKRCLTRWLGATGCLQAPFGWRSCTMHAMLQTATWQAWYRPTSELACIAPPRLADGGTCLRTRPPLLPGPTRVVLLVPGHSKALLPPDCVPLQRGVRKGVAPSLGRPHRRHLLGLLPLRAAAPAAPGAAAAGVQLGGASWPPRRRRRPGWKLTRSQRALLCIRDAQRGAAPGKECLGCHHDAGAGRDSWRVGGGPGQVEVSPLLQQAAGAVVGSAPTAHLQRVPGREGGKWAVCTWQAATAGTAWCASCSHSFQECVQLTPLSFPSYPG